MVLWVSGEFILFYYSLHTNSCRQTVWNLIRRRVKQVSSLKRVKLITLKCWHRDCSRNTAKENSVSVKKKNSLKSASLTAELTIEAFFI